MRESFAIDALLESVEVIPFSADAARRFGVIRKDLQQRGNVIGPFDLLIAAHAIAEDAILVTNNTREFSRIPMLTLEDWLQ